MRTLLEILIVVVATCLLLWGLAWANNLTLRLDMSLGSNGTVSTGGEHYFLIDGAGHYLLIDGAGHKLRIDGSS